jgi:Pectin methylesterase
MRQKLFLLLALTFMGGALLAVNKPAKARITVALDGSGDYVKIQDAINAVPSNNNERTVIFIKKGLYNTEKLIVPTDKKNISLIGEDREKTVISYHIYDCKEGGLKNKCPAEDVAKWTDDLIKTSATITISGNGFQAQDITFQNTAGPVGQALAITITSDKNIFINCNFLGYQDTVYFPKAGMRSYFKECLIAGRTDYIYGSGIVFFEACEIRSFGGGWITAPSTPKDQKFGYIFFKCKLTYIPNSPRKGDDGKAIALGRPWHEYPKVAWIKCNMCKEIEPKGWNTTWRMEYADKSTDLHLYEYKNSGPGADMSNRATWAGLRSLTDKEVAEYSLEKVMAGNDGWNPK